MTSKKQDSGRTMIEMIAVLILVGILTLSGIFGFSWAVQKFKKQENAKHVNTVIVALQNSRIIRKSDKGEPISIKSVVSGPKTDAEGKVMFLSEEDGYFMVVTAMGPEEYIADLQIEPGTCSEYMQAFNEYSALFDTDVSEYRADSLLSDIKGNSASGVFKLLSSDIIDKCEATGRFRAAFNVSDKLNENKEVHLEGKEFIKKCPGSKIADKNGNCCEEEKLCGGVCDCAVCDRTKNECVECLNETHCPKANQTCKDNVCDCQETFTPHNGKCECAPGEYQEGNTCKPCDQNTYKSTYGNGSCTPCDAGKTTADKGSTNSAQCRCAAGYTLKDGTCQQCAVGTYKTSPGNIECTPCGTNQTTDDEGSTASAQCVCKAGYTWDSTQSKCTPCAAGTYKAEIGNGICTPCAAGTYQGDTGATTCEACAAGTYQNAEGQTTCEVCAKGTYQKDTGATSCTPCAAGTYQNDTGKDRCKDCVAGTYQDDTRATTCEVCAVNTYQDQPKQKECKACTGGRITAGTGSTQCVCPSGQNWNGTTCVTCAAGKHWNANTYSCVQCTSHTHCGAGKYCNSNGNCANCANGTRCGCTYFAWYGGCIGEGLTGGMPLAICEGRTLDHEFWPARCKKLRKNVYCYNHNSKTGEEYCYQHNLITGTPGENRAP